MHPHSVGNWFCGPDGIFGFHVGGLFHLVFWAIGLLLLFTLFRTLFGKEQNSSSTTANSSSALSILEERYASGEIDQIEFLQKRKDLK